MTFEYEFGANVRVIRTIRNDGTFPGAETGTKLIPAGAIGVVRNVGTYLQDQVIYTVHFLEEDRMVGCREQELVDADEPWVDTEFEFRDKVVLTVALGVSGEKVATAGDRGEVTKVVRDAPGGPAYHVYVSRLGRTFQVPESALAADPEPVGRPTAVYAGLAGGMEV